MSTHQSFSNYNRRRMKVAAAAAVTASTASSSSTTTVSTVSTSHTTSCSSSAINNNKTTTNTIRQTNSILNTTNKQQSNNVILDCSNNVNKHILTDLSVSNVQMDDTTQTTSDTNQSLTTTNSTSTVNESIIFNTSQTIAGTIQGIKSTSIQDSVHSQESSLTRTNKNNNSNYHQTVSSIIMSPMRSPYNRTRSKSYGGQKGAPDAPVLHNTDHHHVDNASSITNFSFGSFGMPQNFSQVLPNLNSLPEYFNSVSIPNMPNISIPTITMPTLPNLPNLSMPNLSMPNISMPSIPSIPNLNIPSISEIINFPGRKNLKSWSEICRTVKESRERYSSICTSTPFCFHFRYNQLTGALRIYFIASIKGETTLFYCDVQSEGANGSGMRPIFDIEEEMLLDSDMEHDHHQQNQQNANFVQNMKTLHQRVSDFDAFEHAPKVLKRSSDILNSSSSSSSNSSMDEDEVHHNSVDDVRNSQISRPQPVSSPTSSVPDYEVLQWCPLLASHTTFNRNLDDDESTSGASFSLKNQELSREEGLILERKRMPYTGLISYDFHQEGARFVYTIKNVIYWFDDLEILNIASEPQRYVPRKLMTNTHSKLNATICPYDKDFVAYVADNDLWVCNLISGDEIRLTNMSKMKGLSAGQPSFVTQEEFKRFDGYWWRPFKGNDDRYVILCELLDEQNIPLTAISNWDGTAELHYFPKPGGPNAVSSLALVSFSYNAISPTKKSTSGGKHWSVQITNLDVLEDIYLDFEYLINCVWLNSDVITVQLLNRKQTKIVLGIISLSNSFPPQVLFDEYVLKGWYNCHNIFYVYDRNHVQNSGDIVNFLWSSEESGFRHLYKVTVKIQALPIREKYSGDRTPEHEIHKDIFQSPGKTNSVPLQADLISTQQITSGLWDVSSNQIWVDEERDLIYFLSNKQSPLERHLYCVSSKFTPRSMPRRVTQEDYTHSNIHFDPHFNYCIDFQSNLSKPSFSVLHRIQAFAHNAHMVTFDPTYHFLSPENSNFFGHSDEYYDRVLTLGPSPQLFECKLDSGELIYGFFFKPDIVVEGVKYPVLLEIYGGPEVQMVSKSFKDVRQHKRHLLASEGYVVVGFDSRGSKNRGTEFEQHIHRRLGQVEIHDQVQVLQWLAEKIGIIDMNRVAIHGWSYGGYLSLMALAQRPDIFKCCIAGAPVTNWMLYDTGYTERYMGHPDDNPTGYRMSSVISHVRNFPDEQNRLMIIHGLMDENVHFAHTAQLIDALVKAGKPYNLNVFPFERHCLRRGYCAEYYEATLLYYLQQNL